MTTVNLGRIKPIYKGNYSDAVVYKPLDFILYGGVVYFCILQTTAGILPTNATYFQSVLSVTGLNVTTGKMLTVTENTTLAGYATAAQVVAGDAGLIISPDQLKAAGIIPQSSRNAIINGAMNIWQRGVSFTNLANEGYSADRFVVAKGLGDGTINVVQHAETPAVGFPFRYSLEVDCTHIETAVAADEYFGISYRMEGYDFGRFMTEIATLSFWVKAVKTGTYCITFKNGASDITYAHNYIINAANTWEKKTVTLTFDTGTWGYNTGVGLALFWGIVCGSTFQTTADSWQVGNKLGTSSQVNGLDSTNNKFYLTGVQLELGTVATPFEHRTFAQELALCQRYYCRSYNYGDATGKVTGDGQLYQKAYITDSYSPAGMIYFPAEMRINPTITIYSPKDGAAGYILNNSTNMPAFVYSNGARFAQILINNTSAVANSANFSHYTANAEL
jgi:hypothetical protein